MVLYILSWINQLTVESKLKGNRDMELLGAASVILAVCLGIAAIIFAAK